MGGQSPAGRAECYVMLMDNPDLFVVKERHRNLFE